MNNPTPSPTDKASCIGLLGKIFGHKFLTNGEGFGYCFRCGVKHD